MFTLCSDMLDKHPDVCVPTKALNSVSEFTPLHQFFIESMDQTPLSSKDYLIHKQDLFLLLEAYMMNVDTGKLYSVIKMPYYPLNCLPLFLEYYDSKLILVYMNRPIEKIVQSYLRRGEDKLFFVEKPVEILRQVKKLDVKERTQVLGSLSASECFRKIAQRCDHLRDKWNDQNPENTFITVDIEKLSSSREYAYELLDELGLSHNGINEMLSIIDRDRLINNSHKMAPRKKNLTTVKRIIPPIMIDSVKKVIRR